MTILRKIAASSLALAVSAAAGCAPPADDGVDLNVTCEGKCDDALTSVHSLLADARKLDTNDLLAIGAKELWYAAAKALNVSFGGVTFASVQLQAPKAYGLASDAANDLTLGDISRLVSGLASQYGERELTTQVNRLRAVELDGRPGSVFAEASFKLDVGLNTGWTVGTTGFDKAHADIGFTAGTSNEMRLVQRVDRERDAYLKEPLKAVLASRGFVMPTSVDDIGMMQPGEIVARSGSGTVAVNLGASVPLLVTSPAAGVGYGLLFNASLRTQIKADRMDVQVARLAGDQVVIDVGVRDGHGISWRLAVEDGWGALAVPGGSALLNKIAIKLGTLAEKTLAKALGAREKLFSASVSGSNTSSRVSVSRLRFNLASLDDAGKEALAQALYGDLRFAQALAWQKHTGVAQDFDLFRSGESAASYAGVDILGMRFFAEKQTATGQVIVQTPGGARALMFDSLQRDSGWLFSTHGYNRVGLGGLSYDASGAAHTETNLFAQAMEGDKFMERDKLLDQVDAALLEIAGKPALAAIETLGNQIQQYVQSVCPTNDAFSACFKDVLGDPNVAGPRADATAALETAIANLPTDAQSLARSLGALRLAANATHEYPAQFVGPGGSIVLDYRVDDGALTQLLGSDGAAKLNEAVYSYLEATNVDRGSTQPLTAQRSKIRSDKRSKVEALGSILAGVSADYRRLATAETSSVDGVGQVGGAALELRFGLDASGHVDYDNALARSFAEGRMNIATSLFDQLRNAAGGLGPYAEQVVANGLLGAMAPDHRDVRVTVKFSLASESDGTAGHYVTAGYTDVDGYSKGPKAAAINGGMFSIDALLKTEQ